MRYLLTLIGCLSYVLSFNQTTKDTGDVVDYHVHVFSHALLDNLNSQGFSFEKSGFQIIKDDGNYSTLTTIKKDNGNSKMLLISAGYAFKNTHGDNHKKLVVQNENDLLADLVSQNPEELVGFYGLDPNDGFALEELKRCDEELRLNGLKLHLQGNQIDLGDSLDLFNLKRILYEADKRNIPLLIHNNAGDLTSGKKYFHLFKTEILDHFHSLTIIFAHGGGGGGFFQFTKDFLEATSKYLNLENSSKNRLYFELSGVVRETPYPGELATLELVKLMKEIGYEKFLFGSDYPVRDSLTYYEDLRRYLPIEEGELERIVSRNIFAELRK
jgi:predicted TIM-barrel fold metal-dependent hydrolase